MVGALDSLDIDPFSIDAIFITHEHIDHVQGLHVFSNKYNTKIYIDKQTFNALKVPMKEKINLDNVIFLDIGKDLIFNDLTLHPFPISHDAANPCAYNIMDGKNKISVATDLGHINDEIITKLSSSSFILLESNYDPEVLKACPYPFSLKRRISGDSGHISNELAGETISKLIPTGLKSVMLGHLSKDSNIPELAYETVLSQINQSPHFTDDFDLSVANRDTYSKLIEIN